MPRIPPSSLLQGHLKGQAPFGVASPWVELERKGVVFRVGSAPTLSLLADLPSLSRKKIWYPKTLIVRIADSLKPPLGPVFSAPESSPDRVGTPIDRLVQEARNFREEVGCVRKADLRPGSPPLSPVAGRVSNGSLRPRTRKWAHSRRGGSGSLTASAQWSAKCLACTLWGA